MNNKQFSVLICTLIFLSICILFQGGIWEYKSFQMLGSEQFSFTKFNRFTGEALLMAADEDTKHRFVDVAKVQDAAAKKISLPVEKIRLRK